MINHIQTSWVELKVENLLYDRSLVSCTIYTELVFWHEWLLDWAEHSTKLLSQHISLQLITYFSVCTYLVQTNSPPTDHAKDGNELQIGEWSATKVWTVARSLETLTYNIITLIIHYSNWTLYCQSGIRKENFFINALEYLKAVSFCHHCRYCHCCHCPHTSRQISTS